VGWARSGIATRHCHKPGLGSVGFPARETQCWVLGFFWGKKK